MATIRHRRGTAAEWTSANPVLSGGEIGFEEDTGKFKIGDDVQTWSALEYHLPKDLSDLLYQLKSAVLTTLSGYAGLDRETDAALSSNSDTRLPTSKAVRSYVATTLSAIGSAASKRELKNQGVTALTAGSDFVEKFDVINDGTSTASWPSRVEYRTTPVGGGTGGAARLVYFLNEYFEQRLIARQNTVLWRAFVKEYASDPDHSMSVPIWEIQNDRDSRTTLHAVYGDGTFFHSAGGTVGGGLTVAGNLSAPNVGVPIKGVYNSGSEPTGQPAGTVILVRP